MKKILYLFLVFLLVKVVPSFAERISIFCNLKSINNINAWIEIQKVEVKGKEGFISLYPVNSKISTDLPFSQILITTGTIPSGKYDTIKIFFKEAVIKGKKLKILKKTLELPLNLSLKKGDSKSIFLNWDVADSFCSDSFCPKFYVSSAYKPLPGENLFAFSRDTVWVIDPNLNQVVYSFGITGSPQGIAMDLKNRKIYVICKDQRVIKIIDTNSFQVVDFIPIPILQTPEFIAIGEDNKALITSPEDNMILVINLSTGAIVSQKKVDYTPYEVGYLKSINRFIVSSYDEGAAYLYNTDLSYERRLTGGFRTEGFISDGKNLYLTDTQGGIHVYSLPELEYKGKIGICQSTLRGVVADNKIFITCGEGKVIIIGEGGYLEKSINIGGRIFPITCLPTKKWLYVGFTKEASIGVIDGAKEKFIGKISIGEVPRELAARE